jgi:hypothetical protein
MNSVILPAGYLTNQFYPFDFHTLAWQLHTIGFADLRAVSIDMTPVYSGVCCSTDSEAMNIVEVINETNEICGDEVRIYTGNGHTTTKISAGMAFLSHGVIAGGRLHYEPTWNLEESSISCLRENIILLNKVGKLLKDEPELGRVIAMQKHVYVDKLNARKLVEDLGFLILKNVSQKGFRSMISAMQLKDQII